MGFGLFFQVIHSTARGPNAPEMVQAKKKKNFIFRKSGQILEQAAPGSSGVTIPGGFQEKGRCYTE